MIWGGDENCEHKWVDSSIPKSGGVGDYEVGRVGNAKARSESHEAKLSNTCSLCGAWKGAFGLESTPEMYVQHTIEILREIRRVLRKDGVVFWNIGDSYAQGGKHQTESEAQEAENKRVDRQRVRNDAAGIYALPSRKGSDRAARTAVNGLKPKDLCLIPFRVAIAAQDAGWWVRSVIIWSKPNPMPESVTDRPTGSHEYILMLTKSANYYWDADAVREPHTESTLTRIEYGLKHRHPGNVGIGIPPVDTERMGERFAPEAGRNIRSVWEFPTQPYPEAHFAVFPEKLPLTCIKAATPEVGCCSKCGSPWERIVGRHQYPRHETEHHDLSTDGNGANRGKHSKPTEVKTLGWQPTCKCGEYICVNCQSVVLYPYREDNDGAQRPRSKKSLPSGVGKEEIPDQRGSQGADKGSPPKISEGLRPLWEGIQGQEGQPILRSGLLNEVDVGTGAGKQGDEGQAVGFASTQDTDKSGIHQDKDDRTPTSGQSGLCMGAPISGGEETGQVSNERGASSSQERNKARQQGRESSDSPEGAYRSSMPSMPTYLPDKKTCPNCGSIDFLFEASPIVPSTVLDPFSGAGTTLWVAKKLNRRAIGYEISEEYCQLSVERIRQQVML